MYRVHNLLILNYSNCTSTITLNSLKFLFYNLNMHDQRMTRVREQRKNQWLFVAWL